jgi:predicted component of type VI protein secretion system
MKLSLVVADGVHKGKVIPIALSQFLVGRDPQCHLRPASSMISKRHCAILARAGKAHVKDFGSTNGTFLNDKPVEGNKEVEIHNGDQLKIGPLLFYVSLEASVPIDKPTPAPPTTVPAGATPPPGKKSSEGGDDDESIAAMLLDVQEDGSKGSANVGGDGVPTGSTVMDISAINAAEDTNQMGGTGKQPAKKENPKAVTGNTSAAAKAILEKYTRRPRT